MTDHGASDKAFMEKWSHIKTGAEKKFLALQQDFVNKNLCFYSDQSKTLASKLEKDMGQ